MYEGRCFGFWRYFFRVYVTARRGDCLSRRPIPAGQSGLFCSGILHDVVFVG